MRAHPDGFIAFGIAGKWLPVRLRFDPLVGTGAALSCPGNLAEWVQTA